MSVWTSSSSSSQSHDGLMLDAQRTTLQPLMREVTALQKNLRTLQDTETSSSVTSGGSSAGGNNKKSKTQTFIGDPHQDAQALARELSGKLAKSAKVPSLLDDPGATSATRPPTLQRRGEFKHNLRIDKLQIKRRGSKKMTATRESEETVSNGSKSSRDPEIELGVRERIKRIESTLDRSGSATLSGELRREGLIRELKATGRKIDAEIEHSDNNVDDGLFRSDDRWDVDGQEELARKLIEERRASVSSLSQLLGNYDVNQNGNGRSAPNLLRMVQDEEQRSHFAGESLFESDEEELSPMEMKMSRGPRSTMNDAPIPVMLRGEKELQKPRSGRGRGRKKHGSARLQRERGVKLARQSSTPSATIVLDDELAVSELHGCGILWDWSRINKHGSRAFLDLTGLTCASPESPKVDCHGMPELHPHHRPVQSISSLDSDANALPLVIGDDAPDSDVAGFYFRSRETPQQQSAGRGKRKASLQSNAVKDVPGTSAQRTLTQKYRPKNFREIAGQAVVVKSLSTAILKSKVAPVYLFMGPRGTGKTSAARIFAAGLNCLSLDRATRPCGICRECGTMALNRSADVLQIDAASNADLASLRALMGSFTPHARYKVLIVEACDLLSPEIWNSFLKLLEEPPPDVVFILITTDAERIPATATSRCQKFHFPKLKESDIVTRLEFIAGREGLVVETGALALIAARSDGSLRDAEIVLDQLCLVHKTVSIPAVQELVGLLPDNKVLDLLDYALSASTVNIVRTMRAVLASGVEPLVLVSQLGALITDILVGSLDVDRDARQEPGFFTQQFSEREEQLRLREALKILSEAEKQLRGSTDGATWLTAALLQFAPDRSFLLSTEETTTVTRCAPKYRVTYTPDPASDDQPPPHLPQTRAALAPQPHAESDGDPTPEAENNVTTLSERKLEEAWAGEPQQQVSTMEDGGDSEASTETGGAPGTPAEFQVFRDEALAELWQRVVWEVIPRNLKHLLQTHGRLVAAGVAVDGSCAVVELEFDYARDKHKAERSWRSICIAFQAVLSTAVELRIALSDVLPEESEEVAPTGELAVIDTPPSPSAQPQSSPEIVTHPARRRQRRRGTKPRRHRHATELLDNELCAQFSSDPSGVTPRRPPPSRRRRVKRAGAAKPAKADPAVPVLEIQPADQGSSRNLTREMWNSLSTDVKPDEKKKLQLSTMMEEPQSEIDDLQAAQKKILKHRNTMLFRNDSSLTTIIDPRRTSLIADLQRGLPADNSCWKRPSPQSDFLMRKSRVKSVRKPQGRAMFLKLVPCAATHITRSAPTAPIPQLKAAVA